MDSQTETNNTSALDIISSLLADTAEQKETFVNSARQLVSQYWDWFNDQNTKIANNRKVGDTALNVSSIAPVVESRKSGESASYYIVWKKHNRSFRTNMKKKLGKNRNASLPIHSYTSKSIPNILKTSCTWDTENALVFECQFEQMRVAMRGLHEAEVRLRSAKRKLLSLAAKTNFNETTTGEMA